MHRWDAPTSRNLVACLYEVGRNAVPVTCFAYRRGIEEGGGKEGEGRGDCDTCPPREREKEGGRERVREREKKGRR